MGRSPSPTDRRQQELVAAVRVIHAEVRASYGSPRMAAELNARGYAGSENTAADLMRAYSIRGKAPRRFVRTTDSRHGLPVAADVLDRDFDPTGPNALWSADITYIPTADGWLYLAVVEDLFSRMIVGWAMAAAMTSRFAVDALEMAIRRRLPGEGLIAHSDRGSQYANQHHRGVLARHGITGSMSRGTQCWENAPVESFFAGLKRELVHAETYTTHEPAKASIFEYLEAFYNRIRRHS